MINLAVLNVLFVV